MSDIQISAYISRDTKRELERLVRARGLKKGFVIEQALKHHLLALRELPDEAIVPTTLVLERESFERVARELRSPSQPTPALRKLMKVKSAAKR